MWFFLRERYLSHLLVSATSLILLAGCIEGSTNKGGMLSVPEEGSFHFQAFVEDFPTEGEADSEHERMLEVTSHPSIKEVSIQAETEETIENYRHLVDDFPTYILTNHKGIAIKSSDIEEVAEYIENKR